MPLTIRELRADEARAFLEVHHDAVRGTAAADYSETVIAAWAPLPITDDAVAQIRDNAEGEIRLAAVLDGGIVGIGVLAPQVHEMRACYVSPDHGRGGVGRALVLAIEEMAVARGLRWLVLDASITANPFIGGWATRSWAVGSMCCAAACAWRAP